MEQVAPPGWLEHEGSLIRTLRFDNFMDSWAFASKVALIAEMRRHHPDMSIGYNYVTLVVTTHSAGNQLTPADYKLARNINQMITGRIVTASGEN